MIGKMVMVMGDCRDWRVVGRLLRSDGSYMYELSSGTAVRWAVVAEMTVLP